MKVVAADHGRGDRIYASGFRGLFVSDGGGGCWRRMHDGRSAGLPGPNMMIDDITSDPARPGTLYVADAVDGLYGSSDGGESWSRLREGLSDSVVRLAVAPSAPGWLCAALGWRGVYASHDHGQNWHAASDLPGHAIETGELAVDPGDANTVYAGTSGRGVYKTVDGGASWRPLRTGLPRGVVNVMALAIDPHRPRILYLAANSGRGPLGVFRSADGGTSWTAASQGLPTAAAARRVRAAEPANIRGGTRWVASDATPAALWALVIDPGDGAHLYAGTFTHGVFETHDGGRHWRPARKGLADREVLSLALDPHAPGHLYAVTPTGLFRSRDGGASWEAADRGLVDAYLRMGAAAGQSAGCAEANTARPPVAWMLPR